MNQPAIFKRLALLSLPLGLCLWLALRSAAAGETTLPPRPTPDGSATSASSQPLYGLNFVNSIEHVADEQQYANGRATGATWNRWPLYWNRIETADGQFTWEDHDKIVAADLAHGFQINAILLGTPPFYTTSADPLPDCDPEATLAALLGCHLPPAPDTLALRSVQAAAPVGLHAPVFADGSDAPGAGKAINPDNRWARFVHNIVARYKPGGALAQAQGWPAEWGITHWEMWNEPDFPIFWDSSLPDYARLLKVGYLAAKQADPNAQVLFGGLANNGNLNFYRDVLAIYADDPLAAEHNYFHDIFVTHNYSRPWNSWYHVFRATGAMNDYALSKPIWLNESGVPAWNDYPGPVWDPGSWFRATTDEQADFILQNAFYAIYAGADAVFHFQLYDGCGNQPAYTDFPPHNGELCNADGTLVTDPSKPCAGDANGLFRNPADAICFAQHPQPETPRPSFTAFRILTEHVTDVQPLWRSRPGGDDPYTGPQELIALYKPATGERIIGMWSRDGGSYTAEIEAAAGSAVLITPDGNAQTIHPENGVYRIDLPAATNQNTPVSGSYPIGGRTRILIEAATLDLPYDVFLPAMFE